MTNIAPPSPPEFIDNPNAPEVFADGVSGIFNFGGSVRITFESLRTNHAIGPGQVKRVVIGRLVMPLEAVKALADALAAFIAQQEAAEVGLTQQSSTLQ